MAQCLGKQAHRYHRENPTPQKILHLLLHEKKQEPQQKKPTQLHPMQIMQHHAGHHPSSHRTNHSHQLNQPPPHHRYHKQEQHLPLALRGRKHQHLEGDEHDENNHQPQLGQRQQNPEHQESVRPAKVTKNCHQHQQATRHRWATS